ncbi:MAG: PKD domain-containing protein [Bacteroidota bacterium]|nr:PKD domain-containing protein [Bacteroidota bacterium]
MKRIKLLMTMFLLSGIVSFAQTTPTVSGLVSDLNNVAVANHEVEIVAIGDSLTNPGFYFYQIVMTDANGYYSVVIPNYVSGISIIVSTQNCQGPALTQIGFSAPFIANFTICTGGTTSCIADFMFYPDSNSVMTYYFYDMSTGSPTSWTWDFGDGTTSSLQNPTHTYAQNGTYAVTLTILCANGYSTTTQTITIGTPSCNADFIYALVPGSLMGYQYTDLSTGAPTSWAWDFGDGTTSTLQNPTHTYAQNGTYVVTLTISGPNCSDTETMTITTGTTSCIADFMFYPDSNSVMTYYFYDMSTGSPTSWTWDFGDGTTSSLQNPTHTYAQNGTYVVTLTILCANGYNTTTQTIIIGTTACVAAFSYTVDPNSTLMYQFTDLSTGSPTGWYWDFGDGTTSTLQNPLHTYSQAGTYTVTLNISGQNCSDSESIVITVSAPTVLVANFSYEADQANSLLIHFTDLSTGNPISWHWDFGDSNTSTDQNPSHLYSAALNYTVTLTISGTTGTDTETQTITVTQTSAVENLAKHENNGFAIYPNPTSGEFVVEGNNINAIEIIDITGKQIDYTSNAKKGDTKQSINLYDQSKGIYFVKVTSDKDVSIKKLIIR